VLENAIEALPAGGRIDVRTRNVELATPTQDRNARLSPGAYVCAEIADNGPGMEPAVLGRMLEPFFTTKKEHRGLGLALAYGIVTNHAGAIAISSEPGSGTSVRLYLPADQYAVKSNPATAGDLRGDQLILVVDDEDLLLTMAETVLTAHGYSVLTANNGQKALELLSQHDSGISLVITDLVMPAMSGRELVEKIRLLSPETPVLCTSGYVRPVGQQEDPFYLQKPFTSQELLLKLKHALG
jgi:CheY-like chemotaxis protein